MKKNMMVCVALCLFFSLVLVGVEGQGVNALQEMGKRVSKDSGDPQCSPKKYSSALRVGGVTAVALGIVTFGAICCGNNGQMPYFSDVAVPLGAVVTVGFCCGVFGDCAYRATWSNDTPQRVVKLNSGRCYSRE